jgi:hypothetical protein
VSASGGLQQVIIYEITNNVKAYRVMMLTGGDEFRFPMYDRLEQSPVKGWVTPRFVAEDRHDSSPIGDLIHTIGVFMLRTSAVRALADQIRGCELLSADCDGAECVVVNPPRVDCLDQSKCTFRMSPAGRIQEIMTGFVDPSRVTVPLFRPYDARGFNISYFLCTDEFKRAVEHAKLTGFEFRDIATRRQWF